MNDTEMWAMPNGAILYNVHPQSRCDGTPCWVHNPSDHVMLDWPMVQQRDPFSGLRCLYRQCLHGVLHHDPDDRWFIIHILHIDLPDQEDCDGCCHA